MALHSAVLHSAIFFFWVLFRTIQGLTVLSPPTFNSTWLSHFMNVSNEDVQWCEVKMPKSSSIQENYNCDQMGEILDQNEMDKRKCDAFVYSKDVFESSAVTEFDLVCNRNHLKAINR